MNADIFALLLKVSAILAVAALAVLILRQASAAWRHFAWLVAMSSVIVLFALQLIVPPIVVRVTAESPLRAFALPAVGDARANFASPVSNAKGISDAGTTASTLSRDVAEDAINALPAAVSAASSRAGERAISVQHSGKPMPAASNDSSANISKNFIAPSFSNAASHLGAETENVNVMSHTKSWTSFRIAPEQVRTSLIFAWVFGSLLLLLRTMYAHRQLRQLAQSSRVIRDGALCDELKNIGNRLSLKSSVTLLVHHRVNTPCTAGWRNPVIMLPENFTAWSDARRQAVFTHELAHIVRGDSLAQTVAAIACALFWFHPGVWIANRLLRSESERAADDVVIGAGMPAIDYADHLLALANNAAPFNRAPAAAVGMARITQLETRLLALLNASQSRRVMSRDAQRRLSIGALLVVAPLAAVQARTQEPARTTAKAVAVPKISPQTKPVPSSVAHPVVADPVAARPVVAISVVKLPSGKPVNRGASVHNVQPVPPPLLPIAPTYVAVRVISPPTAVSTDSTFASELNALPGEELRMSVMAGGNVTVHGWDQPTARLRARLAGEHWRDTKVVFARDANGIRLVAFAEVNGAKLITSRTGDSGAIGGVRIRIRGQAAQPAPVSLENEFELWVPKQTNVKFSSAGGNLTLQELDGTFTGATTRGHIAVDNLTGIASLRTTLGDLVVTSSALRGDLRTECGSVVQSNTKMNVSATARYNPPGTPPTGGALNEPLMIVDGATMPSQCQALPAFKNRTELVRDSLVERVVNAQRGDVLRLKIALTDELIFHPSSASEIRVRAAGPGPNVSPRRFSLARSGGSIELRSSDANAAALDNIHARFEVWLPAAMPIYVEPIAGTTINSLVVSGVKSVPEMHEVRIATPLSSVCVSAALAHIVGRLRGTFTCGDNATVEASLQPIAVLINGAPHTVAMRTVPASNVDYNVLLNARTLGGLPLLGFVADSATFSMASETSDVWVRKIGTQAQFSLYRR